MFEFFSTLADNLTILKGEFQYRVQTAYNSAKDYIAKFDYESKMYQACFYANRTREVIRSYCLYAYKNSAVLKYVVDILNYSFIYSTRYVQNRRTEPMTSSWSCVSALTKSYHNYKDFAHRYGELYDFDRVQTFAETYETVKAVVDSENSIIECLVTFKTDEKYLHRVYNKEKSDELSEISFEPSEAKFLSIEYHSSDYPEPVVLEIGKNEYLVNNELLSAAYIKRALEYETPFHKFNKNYTVFAMDNDLKNVTLNFGEYIVLNKTGYSIAGSSPNANE
jgi:hypothetical protein